MRTIGLAFLTLALTAAQQAPSFEVASIKPNLSGTNSSSLDRSGGRLTFTNVSLRECIAYAFGIPTGRDQELETPSWMQDAKLDISAKLPEETPRDRAQAMMRTLLADRFHLQIHTETKRVPAYVLSVAKGGPKLKRNNVSDDGAFIFGRGSIQARAIGMTGLANRLSGREFELDRMVIDQTGLDGAFDFELRWAVDGAFTASEGSIFTSMREQLGLELKGQNVEIKVLIVDGADRTPTGN
jgi:uncharacterized protein (TIGR03435 family)